MKDNKQIKPRNLIKIADEIIEVIQNKSDLKKAKKNEIINQIKYVKENYSFRAPELAYIDWNDLAEILNDNLVIGNSDWEDEIDLIFSGKLDIKQQMNNYLELGSCDDYI